MPVFFLAFWQTFPGPNGIPQDPVFHFFFLPEPIISFKMDDRDVCWLKVVYSLQKGVLIPLMRTRPSQQKHCIWKLNWVVLEGLVI